MNKAKNCLLLLTGFITSTILQNFVFNKNNSKCNINDNKFRRYYSLTTRWIMLKNENIKLEEYFSKHNIKSIAIYGMGELGNLLVGELKNSNINICYAIDKMVGQSYKDIPVITPDGQYKKVDTIIVSAIFDFENIEKEIKKYTKIPIISLEDIIFEL